MITISTHVLDVGEGMPAHDLPVRLERRESAGGWNKISAAITAPDGRCGRLLPEGETLSPGIYRLVFDTETYYAAKRVRGLYPIVEVTFAVREGDSHFHLPLLLTPFGYTTYRGS